jgi:predicted AAA+ superfamily ATPase
MAKEIFKRDRYLDKIRPFIGDTDLIKVITGIRRCGKSCLMQSVADEIKSAGVPGSNVVFIDLDSRPFKSVKTARELERVIESKISGCCEGTVYLFIDEVQNAEGFEEVVNAYRNDGGFSIFVTGSNSYLLSGELATKLTGRYVEIEMFTLSFSEFLGMRSHLGKQDQPIQESFRDWLRFGGFPKAVEYDDLAAKSRYIEDVVSQIFEKDIRARKRIRNRAAFEKVLSYVVNNFGAPTNLSSIADYLNNAAAIPIKASTIASYIDLLCKAKVLYRCDRFDMKSKKSLQGGEKYYLADTGIYFARNVDASMNYGPLLENAVYCYLKSHDYRISVGSIGKLEIDFIARRPNEGYSYIQVSMSLIDSRVEEREYRPFSMVRDNWPRYILSLDPLPNSRDGIEHLNLVELMATDSDL